MDIIIAGAGRVGTLLAKELSIKHSVTIIDKDSSVLQVLDDSSDLLTICGNIEDPLTYSLLLNREFDIFISVTDSDEANILSTLIADDAIDVKKKIIRLRNNYFAKSSIASKLGIDSAVFPFQSTARSIEALLEFPKANNVKRFHFCDYQLISIYVRESDLIGEPIEVLVDEDCIAVGVERDKSFFIPDLSDPIMEDDLIYLFGDGKKIKSLSERLDRVMPNKIENIVIFGANPLSIEIAKALSKRGSKIKLIDKDLNSCRKAEEILQDRVTVINSRFVERMIYEDEQIENSDMAICTYSSDEQNIIQSLEAKEAGVSKCVAINNKKEHYALIHHLGIIAARGPKSNTYYEIIEKLGSSNVTIEKHYCGGKGTVFMRKIFPYSILIGKKIKPFKDPKNSYILSHEKLERFEEKVELREGDIIIIFVPEQKREKAKEWIYSL